jgi:hypothetical protein
VARIPLPLGRAFGKGRSTAAGMQSIVNMYAEAVQGEQRAEVVCYGTPGKAAFATVGGGTVRGSLTAAGVQYAVVGTRLKKIATDATVTDIGEIEGSAMVDMAFDGNQLTIVAELKTYEYDVISLVLREVSGGGFEQASACGALASYTGVTVKGTGRWRWRLTNDTSYGALDFATAEAESDNLVSIRKVGNEFALLGDTSVEWWYPTGDPGADAFARTSTAAASVGCLSRDSAIVLDTALTWVGRDGKAGGVSVYRAEGYSPRKISTPEVDLLLETTADLSKVHAFSHQTRGHLFYVLTAPNEWTVAWDIATGQWAPRKSGTWTMGAEPTGGWDAITMALNGSKQIVGASDGNFYELQADTYTEYGAGVVREVTTPQLHFGGRRAFCRRVEMDLEAGVGLTSGQGSDPKVMMCVSFDGGHTWTNPREAGMGAIGQYKWRAVWNVIGSFRQAIFKFRVSDPVKVVFLNAYADVKVGSH